MNHVACYKENYPRPQQVRDSFISLNGKWNFVFDDENIGENKGYFKGLLSDKVIVVPYSYQTPLSMVKDETPHNIIWYEKEVEIQEDLKGKSLMLNFEGSDYVTKVWVNGVYLGMHRGGYCRFSFDIAPYLKNKKAKIIVKCEDTYDCCQPRGKQKWAKDPFGCWYLETNGLWKTVWMEVVSQTHIERIKTTPIESTYNCEFEYYITNFKPNLKLRTIVYFRGTEIINDEFKIVRNNHTYSLDFSNDLDGFKIHWWTPENPQLYDIVYQLLDGNKVIDEVKSYFGFRIFKALGNTLMLNLNPTYLRLTLEQGYYRDGGLTPKDEETIIKELQLTKALGFNGLRMHQKIEDERLYYYCDIMGLFTWCEMPSAYEYRDRTIETVTTEWLEVVKQHYNHPSIIVWVPINESWGVNRLTSSSKEAHFTEALYHLTKAFDSMRPVISNDGWEHTTSDIITFHNYATNGEALMDFYKDMLAVLEGKNSPNYSQLRKPFVSGYKYNGQPIMIDEFAGIGYVVDGEGWGYGEKVSSDEKYISRLESLVSSIRSMKEVCGFCVTQTTDVYQEINGILTMDRKPKVDMDKIHAIISK